MPIYQAVCMKCSSYHEYIRTASNCLDTPNCCGASTEKRILSAPMAQIDFPAYESPASGKMITSRNERREDMKRTGSRPWEGKESELKEAARQKAYEDAKDDAKLDHTVRTAWAALPPAKKAQALAEAK